MCTRYKWQYYRVSSCNQAKHGSCLITMIRCKVPKKPPTIVNQARVHCNDALLSVDLKVFLSTKELHGTLRVAMQHSEVMGQLATRPCGRCRVPPVIQVGREAEASCKMVRSPPFGGVAPAVAKVSKHEQTVEAYPR